MHNQKTVSEKIIVTNNCHIDKLDLYRRLAINLVGRMGFDELESLFTYHKLDPYSLLAERILNIGTDDEIREIKELRQNNTKMYKVYSRHGR